MVYSLSTLIGPHTFSVDLNQDSVIQGHQKRKVDEDCKRCFLTEQRPLHHLQQVGRTGTY